jgi:AcrR family transcriptional regulator
MAGGRRGSPDEVEPSGLPRPGRDGLPHPGTGGREQVSDIQRARMLAAMVDVVAERGAGNVTVARVVARSGVSRRTFYELFTDRDDCFLAAFDDGIARASRYVLDAYDPGASWAERIRSALTGLLSFLDVERGAGRLLIVGSLGAGAVAFERRERVLAQIIAVVNCHPLPQRESSAGCCRSCTHGSYRTIRGRSSSSPVRSWA